MFCFLEFCYLNLADILTSVLWEKARYKKTKVGYLDDFPVNHPFRKIKRQFNTAKKFDI